MSLSEHEIADRMRNSLRECIDASSKLAVLSIRGKQYERLRTHLHLVEGCCRQMAAYRDDARWLPFGMFMSNCHKLAGDWLRGHVKNGVLVVWSPGHMNQMFVQLATELTVVFEHLDKLVTAATGTTGPILPAPPAEERRVGRPGFLRRSKLIVPASYRRVG